MRRDHAYSARPRHGEERGRISNKQGRIIMIIKIIAAFGFGPWRGLRRLFGR